MPLEIIGVLRFPLAQHELQSLEDLLVSERLVLWLADVDRLRHSLEQLFIGSN